ncbi:sensor domain-containing diguanylate cyclase [Thiohalophilus thiocyanatoxydans]|uniref:diguanylate cyclase n=1 Tax=Thiohalophilus thiocyanatoxydans TaxID=381308 RepID=A0A4R8ITN4_9GAMM|nr:diguanylate cyclase [Thiohalophilus thiocyanatoxydans]TDY03988.1 diguanylate cyclase (GGDEF)-like protein [Thiohalophilus thiocyanatoxydans]
MNRARGSVLLPFILGYRGTLLGLLAVTPLLAIFYLHFNQDPARVFEHHTFHFTAITLAILLGLFIGYVTWRCYLESGERFLLWLALGFVGFSVVYAPHGLLTPLAPHNPWLFLLYGPASRLVMAVCFLLAVLQYQAPADTPGHRLGIGGWLLALGIFVLIDALVAVWAYSPWNSSFVLRVGMESASILLLGITLGWMFLRRAMNPLMIIYALSLAWFGQSSFAFTIGSPWNHQWWLAHLIFAGGFLLLSFGVVQAYLSTYSFARVYSQSELMARLRQEKQRAEQALVELQHANQDLERLASTDSLTGAANRRALMARAEQEIARAERYKLPLSLILLDLDHFKEINDRYGHPTGDSVLKAFVAKVQSMLRPSDLLGRLGGEEFAILLPETGIEEASQVAERLQQSMAGKPMEIDNKAIPLTLSAGVVEFPLQQGSGISEAFSLADKQLYRAKNAGRNRVASG